MIIVDIIELKNTEIIYVLFREVFNGVPIVTFASRDRRSTI